ncbi:MAG: bifunctional folylpolyglutamate synthase/dihydrofolate synthase [Deltaproteobacteria bacterium]|nr:MAG: bifunctional folylpolyglutamate synthase/dihydrofolate synthase [Deltaproteobacteria bacterium]
MTPKEALKYIAELDKFGINLGLERMWCVLELLGNPQRAYPSIHVAGTNGKGSTSAIVASILKEAGVRTGFYTSPPLEFFGERMRINGELMPDDSLPPLLTRVLAAAERFPMLKEMTQFEVITAIAFLYFEREKVDAAVVEVGLGGRLDSTNVIDPIATAITNIAGEHMAHLGGTLYRVGVEKAGIAKPGVPLVTGASGAGLEAIKNRATETGAPLFVKGVDFDAAMGANGYTYRGINDDIDGIKLALGGTFQVDNLAIALALVECCREKFDIDDEAVRAGCLNVRWPGRMELFGKGPKIMLDGAHNPHAAKALAEALKACAEERERLILILGVLDDKDAASIVDELAPLADEVIYTRSDSRRSLSPEEFEAMTHGRAKHSIVKAGLKEALEEARALALPEDLILITGSLTMAGQARAILRSEGLLG